MVADVQPLQRQQLMQFRLPAPLGQSTQEQQHDVWGESGPVMLFVRPVDHLADRPVVAEHAETPFHHARVEPMACGDHLGGRQPVAARRGECLQDRLVDVDQVGVQDHCPGFAGQHGKRLAVYAQDRGFGGQLIQHRVHRLAHEYKGK